MTKLLCVYAVALAALITSAARAEGSASSDAPPSATTPEQRPTKAEPDPNKVICKRVEDTGSNIAGHVCKTRAEWAQLSEEHDRDLQDQHRRDRSGPAQITGSGH